MKMMWIISSLVQSILYILNMTRFFCIIHMTTEGSCDTEGWSNDAEKLALTTGINKI